MESIEIVRQLYAAMNTRDGMALVKLFAPEIVWRPNEADPEQDVRRGIRAAAEAAASLWEAFEVMETEIEEVLVTEPRVAVAVRHRARGRESGAETDRVEFHVWTVSDGRVTELSEYPDREQAVRAAAA